MAEAVHRRRLAVKSAGMPPDQPSDEVAVVPALVVGAVVLSFRSSRVSSRASQARHHVLAEAERDVQHLWKFAGIHGGLK